MYSENITLVSHHLCPYVQRAVISLAEKGAPFERRDINLSNKPDWFRQLSPLGKVPLLQVDGETLFESAVILEYLEDTQPRPLHPAKPLQRARHRAWIEFGSSLLSDIGSFYSAPDEGAFTAKAAVLSDKFTRLEKELGDGPWFAGEKFTLVDAVFGPIFRYFETFDQIGNFGILADKPKLAAWRDRLAARPSVKNAVADHYPERLAVFLRNRNSYLSSLMM